jgi:SNARE protein 1
MPDADAVTKALLDVPSEPPELLRSTSLPISSSEKPSSLTEKLLAAPVEVKSADEGHSSTRILSASLQTQEQLSKQLAEMASRLKQNTLHFTDALARDRAVIEGAQEKLEGNLTGMTTQRTRLKAQGSKSGNTTWMVLAAIAVVMIAWILTFLLIRIT